MCVCLLLVGGFDQNSTKLYFTRNNHCSVECWSWYIWALTFVLWFSEMCLFTIMCRDIQNTTYKRKMTVSLMQPAWERLTVISRKVCHISIQIWPTVQSQLLQEFQHSFQLISGKVPEVLWFFFLSIGKQTKLWRSKPNCEQIWLFLLKSFFKELSSTALMISQFLLSLKSFSLWYFSRILHYKNWILKKTFKKKSFIFCLARIII